MAVLQTTRLPTTTETGQYLVNGLTQVYQTRNLEAMHYKPVYMAETTKYQPHQLAPPPEAVPACHTGLAFKQILCKGLHHIAVQ